MKRLIPVLIFFCFLSAQTSTPPSNFATSTGLIGDPYFISSLNNLYWLSTTLSEWDKYYEQTTDIDATSTVGWNSGAGFSPIGDGLIDPFYFSGSYDGQNYTISNLYINRPTTTHVGLFGYAVGNTIRAEIKNLGMLNVNIIGEINVGALVGSNNWSIVDNCYSTGAVFGNGNVVGGLVGQSYTSSEIKNSYSTATAQGAWYVGGLAGYNHNSSSVLNSYSTGNVISTGVYAGGLVGSNNNSTVLNCYSISNISSSINYIGGLVGVNVGGATISNSYSRGNVTRSSGTNDIFGAFCAYNASTITHCYSTGDVIYTGVENPTTDGFVKTDASGTYASNFWDSEASNQTTAIGATAKTTAQMKDVATFTDYTDGSDGLSLPVWDFATNPNDDDEDNDYWDMDISGAPAKVRTLAKVMAIDDGYPFLDFQNGEDVALPVELSYFTVESTLNGVLCQWTTESEIENIGFLLERKTEGSDWTEIVSYKTDNGLLGQGTTSSPTDYEFVDTLVEPNTTYEYRLADIDYEGVVTYHSVRTVIVEKAPLTSQLGGFTVMPAYPNPFNPSTTITYGLDIESQVSITIYDISGKLITTLLNTEQNQGWHSIDWNGTDSNNNQVPTGIYLTKITSNNTTKTTKLMLLK